MKPLYRCEYCEFTGTEEEVKEHEATCIKNYNLKGCLTCVHCNTDGFKTITCMAGREIPEGQMYQNCSYHKQGKVEVTGVMKVFSDLFSWEDYK